MRSNVKYYLSAGTLATSLLIGGCGSDDKEPNPTPVSTGGAPATGGAPTGGTATGGMATGGTATGGGGSPAGGAATSGAAGGGAPGGGGAGGSGGDTAGADTGGTAGSDSGTEGISGPEDFGSIDQTEIGEGACTGEVNAQLWTLTNENGLVAKFTDFGATMVQLWVPDKNGVLADIVQGFDDVSGYANSQFAGATVGRVGNRIDNGTFSVDGMEYTVTGAGPADADPPNHSLHGGPCGWDKQMWTAETEMTDDGPQITFSLTSPDGDMNFPGEVMATSTYTLTNDNELRIVMAADADAATPINMLHHSYFNLGGVGSGSVYTHELTIEADQYTPAGATGVPDGTLEDVAGTPFDFTTARPIGTDAALEGVGDQDPPGYDHNWVVNGDPGELRTVAKVRDPVSGRVMTIEADQPGVQFYTTNFRPAPDSTEPTLGKNGVAYRQHEALALETQKHPNAINFPDDFDGAGAEDEIIRPEDGETYTHTMVHTFSIEVESSITGPQDFGSIDQTAIGEGACTGVVDAQLWTLTNENGLVAKFTDFGATMVQLWVPDKNGVLADIVQGFDDVSGYANSQFAGATVGRVGNRIDNGTFSVDDTEYTVTGAGPADADPANHSLHGGPCGWDKQMWTAETEMTDDGPQITFSLTSPDGDMGFPGEVMATSTYTLTNDNELIIEMTAEADEATPINMLHHSYFNLGGVGSGSVYTHELTIEADQYTPAGATGVPDGTLEDVDGTPFDFTTARLIGETAAEDGVGDQDPPGYDHNWVVNGDPGELRTVAKVRDPVSGRVMTIEADQPGVQFYTTNFRPVADSLEPTLGKNGVAYRQHEALALETQKHPNAINFADDFDGAGAEDEIIRPEDDETYSHMMVHTFSIEE